MSSPDKRSLDELLSLVRNNPPARPLHGDEQVEEILSRPGRDPRQRHSDESTPNRRFLMGALVAILLVTAGALLMMNQGDVERSEIARSVPSRNNGTIDARQMRQPDTPTHRPLPVRQAGSPGKDTTRSTPIRQTKKKQKSIDLVEPPEVREVTITLGAPTLQDADTAFGANLFSGFGIPLLPRKSNRLFPTRITLLEGSGMTPPHRPELNISGTRYIDLTPRELKKLGIHHRDGKLEVFGEERFEITKADQAARLARHGYDTTKKALIVRFGVTIDTMLSDIDAIENSTPNSYSNVAPIVVQCHYLPQRGMERKVMIFFNRSPILTSSGGTLSHEDMEFLGGHPNRTVKDPDMTASPSINRLVAVRVLDDGTLARGVDGSTAEILLWYLPTREFIDLLPDRHREALRKEVATIAAVERAQLPPGEICERLSGEQTYLDICRTGAGAVQIDAISPNPAQEKIRVHFRLRQPRTVSISLHDLAGRFISQLAEAAPFATGEHSPTVNLGSAGGGTYLVALKTAEGEQVVQRIIVR